MSNWNTVAIIGVGLIGGSLGLALREKKLANKIVGIGRRAGSLKKARQAGAVDSTTTDLARGVKDADLVIVCTPVGQIVEFARQAAAHGREGALITDVGSAKESIVNVLSQDLSRGVAFVGSHPLAGSEKAGVEFARADLFEGRVTVVTPHRRTKSEHYSAIAGLWESLGSRVVRMTPAAHDAAVAATSHVPHLLASALAAATPEELLPLTAGGWLDTTRVAAGDAELWRQILAENSSHVLNSLAKFEKVLKAFRAALEDGDQARLLSLLEAGKQTRDTLGS
jgi:prephenate dehydrogenase